MVLKDGIVNLLVKQQEELAQEIFALLSNTKKYSISRKTDPSLTCGQISHEEAWKKVNENQTNILQMPHSGQWHTKGNITTRSSREDIKKPKTILPIYIDT